MVAGDDGQTEHAEIGGVGDEEDGTETNVADENARHDVQVVGCINSASEDAGVDVEIPKI